ncbi:hypothetical protein, conserved [Trypanosoma brucei gambiense DAL972]|uniref:Transmembrane protein n=1 Tax=Trypanosoma brucei gambiense (strain MHOM/CI/86/DAL972) TaxID=679716 RepID=C9ZTJ5_TRYB9|nr:hypothetical protein, conserved [Trypanosoma brucei gambiense DAL972]CBH12730.1 hypothetical protein, conserved [Trypanosoma brucei gambiense DAL972]|eukprot:XP_011775010.1 hypothetical protein, conserved [Trypanosoma brucei gambiense DAL972]
MERTEDVTYLKLIPMCTAAERSEASLLLGAFVGCFSENDKLDLEVCDDSRYVLRGIRKSLRQLVYDGNGVEAKETLERLVHIVCERRMATAALRSPFVAPNTLTCYLPSSAQCERRGGVTMIRVLRELVGTASSLNNSIELNESGDYTGWPVSVLPCPLLYVVYYLTSAQCSEGSKDDFCSPWAKLFFGELLSLEGTENDEFEAVVASYDDMAGTCTCGPTSRENLPHRQQPLLMKKIRHNITRLFSTSFPHHGAWRLLSFMDVYSAWIRRDLHRALEGATQALHAVTFGEDKCTMLWIARHVLRFIHAFAVAATTNLANHDSRREMECKLEHVNSHYNSSDDDSFACNDSIASQLYFPHSPSLLLDVRENFRFVLFSDWPDCSEAGERRGEDKTTFCRGDGVASRQTKHVNHRRSSGNSDNLPSGSATSRQFGTCRVSLFVSLLEVWLRAKKHTDAGEMVESRILIVNTLDSLFDNSASDDVPKGPFSAWEHRTAEYMCPIQWLRQVLLVNCAALVDSPTVLHMLWNWPHPLTTGESVFLAVCPTLTAGGLHSPILSCVPFCPTTSPMRLDDFIQLVDCWPLPVQVPLLMQRIWYKQQELQRPSVDKGGNRNTKGYNSTEGDMCCEEGERRLSLQWEVLHLCEILVDRARGLSGTLELSFTECSPHRALLEAITTVCELQEDILRVTATCLAGDHQTSSSRSPSSCSVSSDGTEVEAPNRADITTALGSCEELVCLRCREVFEDSASLFHRNGPTDKDDQREKLAGSGGHKTNATEDPLLFHLFPIISTTKPVVAHEVFWLAHKQLPRWAAVFLQNYGYLKVSAAVCRLRIAAAAFDPTTPQLAAEMLAAFPHNAVVAVHAAASLFASLHIVQAKQCINEAVQEYPHSAELHRVFHMIHSSGNRKQLRDQLKETPQRSRHKSIAGITYSHQYRGMCTVRYKVAQCDSVAHWLQVFASVVCVFFWIASLGLYFFDNVLRTAVDVSDSPPPSFQTSNETAIDGTPAHGARRRWSFKLFFSPLIYLSAFLLVYAITAAVVVPIFAGRQSKWKRRCALVNRFLRSLLEEQSLVNTALNRINFCLRGMALVNIITAVQLVTSNIISLRTPDYRLEATNWMSTKPHVPNTLPNGDFTNWCIALSLLLPVLLFGVAFHGTAWRVVRGCDTMVGSATTYTTVFFIDLTTFIIFFPLHFICSVLVEPLLFTLVAAFTIGTSLPVLLERLPLVPPDSLLHPLSCPSADEKKQCHDRNDFCARSASFFSNRLLANMPPTKWSPNLNCVRALLCAHEVVWPPDKAQKTKSQHRFNNFCSSINNTNGCQHPLQQLLCRCIRWYITMHSFLFWGSVARYEKSGSAVRLELVHEGYRKFFQPQSAASWETATQDSDELRVVTLPSKSLDHQKMPKSETLFG